MKASAGQRRRLAIGHHGQESSSTTPSTIMKPQSHTIIFMHATTSRYEGKTFEMTEGIYITDVADLSASTQATNSATFVSQVILGTNYIEIEI